MLGTLLKLSSSDHTLTDHSARPISIRLIRLFLCSSLFSRSYSFWFSTVLMSRSESVKWIVGLK